MDECQKLSQLLRDENARLKDRVLSLQSENRDYADRAVDDLRRLTARDKAIARLERDIQAYQGDRERLAAAYEQLRVSLGQRPEDNRTGSVSEHPPDDTARRDGDRQSASKDSRPRRLPQRDEETTNREPPPGWVDQPDP
jgi:hypothetical protein